MKWRRQYVYVLCWELHVITCVKSLVLGLPCVRCWIYSFFTIQALWGFNSIVQWKYDTRGWVNMSQAGVLNILVRRKDHFTIILEIGVCHWQHVTCIYSFLNTILNSNVFKLMPLKKKRSKSFSDKSSNPSCLLSSREAKVPGKSLPF